MNTSEAYLETPTHVLYAGRCLRIEDLPAILHPSTPALCRDELGQVAPGHSIPIMPTACRPCGHDGATVARFPGATAGHMPTP